MRASSQYCSSLRKTAATQAQRRAPEHPKYERKCISEKKEEEKKKRREKKEEKKKTTTSSFAHTKNQILLCVVRLHLPSHARASSRIEPTSFCLYVGVCFYIFFNLRLGYVKITRRILPDTALRLDRH